MRAWTVALAIVTLGIQPARADPVAFGINAHLGLGTPVGGAGLGAEMAFSWARVEVGVGYGLTGSVQYAITAMGLVGPRRRQLGLGLGASMGGYVYYEIPVFQCSDFCDERTWKRAYWINAQLEYRIRLGESWHVAPYGGASRMLDGDDFKCTAQENDCSERGKGSLLLFLGVMLGRKI
jgi:hypothetical protein